jgi:hypothetical protein
MLRDGLHSLHSRFFLFEINALIRAEAFAGTSAQPGDHERETAT